MPDLVGFAQVIAGDGSCTEVLNGCRSLAYLRRQESPRPDRSWSVASSSVCTECCCSSVDEGDYTFPSDYFQNPAPWADPGNPASEEFFGLMLDPVGVRLESSASARRAGASSFENVPFSPRVLTITGTIVANSCRGTAYGEEWLVRQFSQPGFSSSCGGYTLRVGKFCVDPAGPEFVQGPIDPYVPIEDVAGAKLCDPDDDPVGLEPLPDRFVPRLLTDTGLRDLTGVKFLSIDRLDDEPMPCCAGKRVFITLEVFGDATWFPEDSLQAVKLMIDEPFDPCRCVPFDWGSCVAEPEEPCGLCGLPCDCDLTPTVPLTQVATSGCYCAPLSASKLGVLTPVLPWSVAAGFRIEIFGGSGGLANTLMQIHEAIDGVPHPITPEGCRIYASREPCAVAEIVAVSPNSKLVIDGKSGRTWMECPGRAPIPGGGLIAGDNNTAFRHPQISCGRRYWVTFSTSCYGLTDVGLSDDSAISLTLLPFEIG